jgi:hypothetical protein
MVGPSLKTDYTPLIVSENDITDFERRYNLPGIGRKALKSGIWKLESDALSGAGNEGNYGNNAAS